MKKRYTNQKSESKPTGIEARIKDLTEINMPMVTTLYGRAGTGKTTIASSYPKPQLIIDIKDKGTESAKSKNLVKGDIKVIELENFEDMYDIYDYIKASKKYKSVVIDHLTSLQEYSNQYVKEQENKDQMSQRMFGMSSGYMKEIIQLYKDLADEGIDPVFIVQDRTTSGDGEGDEQLIPEVGPALMPSVATFLCAASRIIGNTYLYELPMKKVKPGVKVKPTIEFRLRLGPNPYYITKVTRVQESPCPAYIAVDLQGNIYDQLVAIVKGDYKEPTVGRMKKKRKRIRK